MLALLLACFVLITAPIASVQYTRRRGSILDTNNHPGTRAGGSLDGADRDTLDHAGKHTTLDGAEEPVYSLDGETGCKRAAREIADRVRERKPWDPPRRTWRHDFHLLSPIQSRGDAEGGGGGGGDDDGDDEKARGREEEERVESLRKVLERDGSYREGVASLPAFLTPREQSASLSVASLDVSRAEYRRLSVFQCVLLVLAFLIFLFAFAVLVAHCLAWFVVYKTEARLGEARKGMLRGGEMRVCLCAR